MSWEPRVEQIEIGTLGVLPVRVPVVRYGSGSPRLGVLAGVHGNETSGLYIIDELLRRLRGVSLRGELTVIPVANPIGIALSKRIVPGELQDLNRIFPGRGDGTFPEVLAHRLFEVVRDVDFLVDLHTFRQINPLLAVFFNLGSASQRQRSLALIQAFGPDVVWEVRDDHPPDTIYLNALGPVLAKQGVPNTVIELSVVRSWQDQQIPVAARGICNIMSSMGMIDADVEPRFPPHFATTPYFARGSGLFRPGAALMSELRAGDLVGELTSLPLFQSAPVRADGDGVLLQIHPRGVVGTGSNLYILGTRLEV